MREDLSRAELIGVPGDLIGRAKPWVRVPVCAAVRIIVISNCHSWLSVRRRGVSAGAGRVTGIRPGIDVRVRRLTVNVNSQSCGGWVSPHRVVNEGDVLPFANLIRNLTDDVKVSAGVKIIIHSDFPTNPFGAEIAA